MTDINSGDYHRIKGSKSRRADVRYGAEYLAQTDGGEIEDHIKEADRLISRDPIPYRDDDLTGAGYALKETYNYTDPTGKLLYQSVRYEHTSVPGAKQFRQRRPCSDVRWVADAGHVKVPYHWLELIKRPTEIVFWVEGEKDVHTLANLGLLATTAAGQKLSPIIAKALTGRDVVIIPDNDDIGRRHADKAEHNLQPFAASVRLIELPGLRPTEDVTDWLNAGHAIQQLREIVESTRPSGVHATPAPWIDPKAIAPRCWIYGPHYIRQFISLLISTGGIGKSSLVISEVLSMVSGKPLLGVTPREQKLRVWYWNGEDPLEELHRRFAAAQLHFGLTPADIGERLFIDSGHDMRLVIAEEVHREIKLAAPLVERLIEEIRRNKIDVLIIDPFVTCHRVNENDNAAIERVAKAWARIAQITNCSILLVHHSRKNGTGDAFSVDDGRGASALLAAARTARALNTMTKQEAQVAGVEERERRRYFRADIGKANLTRPAEAADWFKLVSVDLENGPWEHGGDNVGVVTAWSWPRVDLPQLTPYQISAAQAAIKVGRWRADMRSKNEPWVGIPIAQTLGIDLGLAAGKRQVIELIEKWVKAGWLSEVWEPDARRQSRKYIVVGKPATLESTAAQPGDRGDG